MNYYNLMRAFWNFAFENPEKIKPGHCAVYGFAVEHCNRLGWKEKFGFPTTMVMEAVGIRDFEAYGKILKDLVEFGFMVMIEKSRNQYSANIIALRKNREANREAGSEANSEANLKAMDVAFLKHDGKHTESEPESILESNPSIIRPLYNIQLDNTQTTESIAFFEINAPMEWEHFQMRFKKKFDPKEWLKFLELFDCKVTEEKLEYSTKIIGARLTRFAINYVATLDRENKKEKESKSIEFNTKPNNCF
jgi:hypothetical protein